MKLSLIGILLVFTCQSYATCSKVEIIKLVDTGFNKTEINNICNLKEVDSTTSKKTDKWLIPTDSTCLSNGGQINEKGICEAYLYNAKKICQQNNARLPTINELKKLITDCGGTIDAQDKNLNNRDYQSCLKKKNFDVSPSGYLSSSPYASDNKLVWGANLHAGFTYQGFKSEKGWENSVRCVNKMQ